MNNSSITARLHSGDTTIETIIADGTIDLAGNHIDQNLLDDIRHQFHARLTIDCDLAILTTARASFSVEEGMICTQQ